MKRVYLVLGWALLSLLSADTVSALDVPHLSGQVVDLAGIIPADHRESMVSKLQALEARTGAQMVVLTVPSLDGEALEEFTIRVVETWQLGQSDKDNGVLLFVAQKERRLRLEVGYGLEPVLTDALSRRILDNIVTPAFRQGDFGGGLEQAVDAVVAVISGQGEPPALRSPRNSPQPGGCFVIVVFLLLFFVLPTMMRLGRRRRGWSSSRGLSVPWIIGTGLGNSNRGSSWGGGGFGGFSGGGGGFGGGGSSGGW